MRIRYLKPSAMKPYLTATLILSPPCTAGVLWGTPTIQVIAAVVFTLKCATFLGVYFYWMLRDPDKFREIVLYEDDR